MTSIKEYKKKHTTILINFRTKKNKNEKLQLLKCKPKSCDFQLKIIEPIQEDGREEHKINPKIKIRYSNQHKMNKNKTQALVKMKV